MDTDIPWSTVRRALASASLVGTLLGCGSNSLPPFDTKAEPPPKGVTENFTRIGVCSNPLTATADQVAQVARDTCEPGTTPYLLGQDTWLTCPLLTPVRATFACLAPGITPPAR